MFSSWITEIVQSLDRNGVEILFGEHAAKDKNLTIEDIDYVIKTVRIGKVAEEKSHEDKKRICFKNYFSEKGETYFVVTEYYPAFIKIITLIKKKGKY